MKRDIRKKNKGGFLFFSFYFLVPNSSFFVQVKEGLKKNLKDYFVPDSHFFNQWRGAYSGSELWGVLPDFFYQLKAPISILFLLCVKVILDNLRNLRYKSFVYLGVSNHPLIFILINPLTLS